MRSARLLMTTAAASAVLALAAPGAYASGDWDHDDSTSSHSKEHHKDKDAEHAKPHGGMHTGGGALTAVTGSDDWNSSYKDSSKEDWGGSGEKDKPHGGMHTGGGALAGTPGVTAGGLAVLALAATGAYTLRRKKTVGGLA